MKIFFSLMIECRMNYLKSYAPQYCSQKRNIGGAQVPIEFLSFRNTLEAHLRPGAPLI